MHVIGTAGHVDHGKTSLIEALTGINADRLPEEKQRGMTIDLGFAHFTGTDGEEIGVIDVPGHERFIRNMTAGAWSLSCAMLLVAADDGWMAQSRDHALVLEALRVPRVIIVITKKDLAEEDRILRLQAEAQAQGKTIFGRTPPCIAVSAKTGENLPELKILIETCLSELPPSNAEAASPGGPARDRVPCLYVDRVFNMKGAGTVVTGSLTGGGLATGDEVFLLPAGGKATIRGIQSYNSVIDKAVPVSRVALNLQGVKKEDIHRGVLITTQKEAFWRSKEFVIHLSPPGAGEKQTGLIRNRMELEVSFGTVNSIARFYKMDNPEYGRVVLEEEAAASWNQPCVLIRRGGSVILGKGYFVWPGYAEKKENLIRVLNVYGTVLPSLSLEEFRLLVDGYLESRTVVFSPAFPAGVIRSGSLFLLEDFYTTSAAAVTALAGKPGGASKQEIAGALDLPRAIVDLVIQRVVDGGGIKQTGSVFVPPDRAVTESLSKMGESLLSMAKTNGQCGLEIKNLTMPGAQKELRNLVRIGVLIALEDGIYYSPTTYETLKTTVLYGFAKGDRFTVPQAKDRTGLSRKYMLPLLNKMEEEGFVKRDGNDRIVL